MDDSDYKSLILYYGREKFYHLMQNTALDGLRKFAGASHFRLFNGFALVLGNRIQEGIRELMPIQMEKDFAMSAVLGLMYAHKRCAVIDKEALQNFEIRLKDERKRVSGQGALYASTFLLLCGKIEKARDYADKAIKLNRDSIDAIVLKGWIELYLQGGGGGGSNNGTKMNKTILEYFDRALNAGKNIDANLGQMKYYQLNNDFEEAISILNKLSVRYPELNVPLIEKMKTQLASWNFDHAMETSSRILNLEPTNIEALRVKILVLICRDGNYSSAIGTLQFLYSAIDKVESTNCDLYLQIAQLFSRVCGRNRNILELTYKFIDKAVQMSPGNADYATEMGYHSLLLERYKEATKYFRMATKLDDSSIYALCGLTLCQISESGASEQVQQQIEFLNEIQGAVKNPLLLYMSAKILHANNTDKTIAYLVQACEVHFKNLKTLSYGSEYLRCFNPDFLLQITNELLKYAPDVQTSIQTSNNVGSLMMNTTKDSLHISLKHSLNILETIVKACPGLIPAVYQLAKVEYLCGEINAATLTLQKILLDLDTTFTDAHLLLAQIHIQQQQIGRAAQSLDICLSHNFKVRENPQYHLLNGIIKKSQEQYEEAQKCFTNAMNLCGINVQSLTSTMSTANSSSVMPPVKPVNVNVPKDMANQQSLSLSDRVTLYLEMIEVYRLTNQPIEAQKLMDMAYVEFLNTPEEGRLIIANANLALQNGNTTKVIELLSNIQPGQPYYLQGKTKLASVYLHYKKDRLSFTQCFKELVENCPGSDSYLMLGDAYMSIQEPDEAIEAFKEAVRQNPNDPILASKLGRAYVKTHQYLKAINYYKEATSFTNENTSLKLDLAELYLKLKQYTNAEQTLIEEIDSNKKENDDIFVLQTRTKQLLLLARIRERSGHLNSSLSTLKEAHDNQYRLQKRISLDQSNGNLQEQHRIMTKICVLIAEQSISLRDNKMAIEQYKNALKFSENDIIIMAALARLYMQMNEMDKCQEACASILQMDQNNETASVMMADLSFRQMDFDNAAYHFSQLLISQPTYWTALARLIEVMRRSATLNDLTPFLVRAEQVSVNAAEDAGLSYCKGLNEWYTGNPNSALRHFNNARKDSEWGQQAIFNMIEICLNPDGDLPQESSVDIAEDMDFKDSRSMALRTAERLLKELKPRPGGMDNEALNLRLLKNFLNLASRQKFSIESALADLTAIASQEEYKEHVGPILGIATANILLKQTQRARNQLKRVAKNTWTFEDAEYLERCWLLLADIYIQSNKNEMATELLQKILEHNKSCAKAYELCGYIGEKEQSYRTAAFHYDSAWRFGGKSKPAIGYKLAYNYMKTKKYADAIDICQQVLKLHPDYPSIKKDILEKCRNNLRT